MQFGDASILSYKFALVDLNIQSCGKGISLNSESSQYLSNLSGLCLFFFLSFSSFNVSDTLLLNLLWMCVIVHYYLCRRVSGFSTLCLDEYTVLSFTQYLIRSKFDNPEATQALRFYEICHRTLGRAFLHVRILTCYRALVIELLLVQ